MLTDDARHLARHGSTPGSLLTFWFSPCLLYNSDFVPRLNELGEVGLESMIGNTRERHAVANAHFAAGENNVADARNNLCVVVKCFIEVAQAKEDDRIWELLFDAEILFADGSHHEQ